MKILVEKNLIEDMFDRVSWMANQKHPYKPGDGSDFDEVYRILEKILLDNKPPYTDKPEPYIKNTSEAFSKQTVELELNNKYAIVEILDMLIEHAKYDIEAHGIDSKVFTMPLMFDAENLKNRLIGEK